MQIENNKINIPFDFQCKTEHKSSSIELFWLNFLHRILQIRTIDNLNLVLKSWHNTFNKKNTKKDINIHFHYSTNLYNTFSPEYCTIARDKRKVLDGQTFVCFPVTWFWTLWEIFAISFGNIFIFSDRIINIYVEIICIQIEESQRARMTFANTNCIEYSLFNPSSNHGENI